MIQKALCLLLLLIFNTFSIYCFGIDYDNKGSNCYFSCYEGIAPEPELTPSSDIAIVIPQRHNLSIQLAAHEIQFWLKKVLGVSAPVTHNADGRFPIFVGATESILASYKPLAGQEYIVDINEDRILLFGSDTCQIEGDDTINFSKANGIQSEDFTLTLPDLFENVTTCYAVYDFIEKYLDVRFYGPDPKNVVFHKKDRIMLNPFFGRKIPVLKYRYGTTYTKWPIEQGLSFNPTEDMSQLFFRRLRMGGLKYRTNHSFISFQDRFLNKDNEIFEEYHPEYFAKGQEGGAYHQQLCYTDRGLIEQVARDAIDYFQKGILKGKAVAMGDYYSLTPMDNNLWCKCDNCQQMINKDKGNINGNHFNNGVATNYIWNFINEVAKIVKKECPDKYIVGLAYHDYAFYPSDVDLEDNVVVDLCTHTRHWGWSETIKENELSFYEDWVDESKQTGRQVFMWNYYCFPMEKGVLHDFNVFPGFTAHLLGTVIEKYQGDGIDGVFLCGIGEQLDYYLTMKMYFDPKIEPDVLIDEFFERYFGMAAAPMKNFYELIETVYNNPKSYPKEAIVPGVHAHMTEEIAWRYLGTDEIMQKLDTLINQALSCDLSGIELQRVKSWKTSVYDYMVEGRKKYLNRIHN